MSWLSDRQIEKAIQRHGDVCAQMAFRGIYPLDTLPDDHIQGPLFLVMNTDVHNLPGRHWKAIFIDEQQHGEVFDPLATPMSDRLIHYMNQHTRKWTWNRTMVQHPLSPQCGVYVVFYVTQRLYYNSLNEFCQLFSHDLNKNELSMSRFYQ